MMRTKTNDKTKLEANAVRILKLSAYCYPEQESSSHLTDDLYEAYENAGYHVENYVPTPTRGVSEKVRKEYSQKKTEELYNGHIVIHRFAMFKEGRNPIGRAIRYLLVNIVQYWKGIHADNIDIVYSGSTPPTQGMLCSFVKRRLSRKYGRPVAMVFAIQDIFPDSLVASGLTRQGSLLWRLGRRISNYAYKNADRIITIDATLKQNIIEKGVPKEKIEVIPNWIDTNAVYPINRDKNKLFEEYSIDRNKFIVLYAGNMGASQGTMVIAQAAAKLREFSDIYFVIFGDGTEKENVISESKNLNNISVYGLLPVERVSEVYSLGNVALITCKKGVGKSSVPSKLWSIMACNTPIIASFDTDSTLAETIKEASAGRCVDPEDADALAKAIYAEFLKWKNNKKLLVETRSYVFNHASKEVCTQRYVDIIHDCVVDVRK